MTADHLVSCEMVHIATKVAEGEVPEQVKTTDSQHDAAPTATRTTFARSSRRSQALARGLRATAKPALNAWSFAPTVVWPSRVVDRAAERLTMPAGASVETLALGPCSAEWIRGPGVVDGDRAVLYLHGGALITCGLSTHRRMVAWVSHHTDAPALNVDFRMMPQVTIEHMVSDCLTGYRWLLASGFAADKIAIVGDSAGGFLAFMTALAIRDEGMPMPGALAAMSPLLDLGLERKMASPFNDRCDVFSVRACAGLNRFIARVDREHEVSGTRISPIDAEVHDLPSTLIQVGSREILRLEAEEMVANLARANVPAEIQIWKGQVHVFQAASSWLPEARVALRELGSFVRDRTGTAPGVNDK